MAIKKSNTSVIGGAIALLFFAFMIYLLFQTVSMVFSVLSWFSIPLFLLALIFDYKVVTNYFNWIMGTIKKEPAKGILYGCLTFVGWPLVSAWLAFKAYASRKFKKTNPGAAKTSKEGEYIKYKEVNKEESDDFLDLEDLDKYQSKRQPEIRTQARKSSQKGNDYEDLF